MANRETQVDIHAIIQGNPNARVTSVSVHDVMMGRPNARVSNLSIHVIQPTPNPNVKTPQEFVTP